MNTAHCIQTLSSGAYPCQTAMALVDETSCPSLFVGNDGFIMRTNQLFSTVSGYEINDINGKRWTEFLDTKGQGDITESIVSSFRFYREHTINIYDCALIDYRNKMKELAIEIKRAKGGFLALFHVIPYFKSKVETMPRCETQKTYNSFVEALMKTMMSRDPLIAAHEQAVSDLAGRIADQMELSSFTCEGIRIASLIHDSGNLSVPMDILTKSEMLSEEEWEVIRSHPRMGYEIIRHVKFPWPVAATVLQHHERLNGSGYPYGLKSDEIMIEARILAVADTYIAMRSQRPYRTPVDHEWAMAELYAGRGFLFDERAVDACARCVRV
jgi:HD-GYP domain-containing protein (c-di-GMP phosphodiesterase class II)